MALDRQSIEKQDFPVGGHGYDPEAVAAHLSVVADEIEEFKSAARRRSETVASTTSDQVRTIIEAAEASAAEIQRQAEAEAREIRQEADNDARSARDNAHGQVGEHVSKVTAATAAMLARLDGMEAEVSGLIESLRSGANRLDADLRLLEADVSEVGAVARPAARIEFEPDPGPAIGEVAPAEGYEAPADPYQPPADGYEPPLYDPTVESPEMVDSPEIPAQGPEAPVESYETSFEPAAESAAAPDNGTSGSGIESFGGPESGPFGEAPGSVDPWGAPEPSSFSASSHSPAGSSGETAVGLPTDSPGEGNDDPEGARLIALNMALNGTPREETARYLSENFQLSDRDRLLDEVYASVEG